MQLNQFYDIATKVSSRKKCYYFWWSTWLFKFSGTCIGQWNFPKISDIFRQESAIQNVACYTTGILFRYRCVSMLVWSQCRMIRVPDGKVQVANMGPTWGRQDPGWSHVGPMNFAIRGGGGVSIKRCRLTSIWIPMLKIRWSRNRLIFNMGIPYLGKTVFI